MTGRLRPVRRVRARAGPGRARRDEAGTLSLELVLVVPVLVLLTVFVLWAGRGGRAALTADLAAEEAATAAALCCDEDSGGASGREALVEDVLEARPGLGFLCIGGPRPDAGVGSDEFLSERWLEFEPGRGAGGVGVLGVQFLCESDGAVAPLRGLFPTVTFHGQASEVVLQEPRFVVGFKPTRVEVVEGTDPQLVFTVRVEPAQGEEVTLTYVVVAPDTTAAPEDFDGGFAGLNLNSSGVGTVVIPAIADSAQIVLPLFDDDFFEGEEELVLNLTGALPPAVQLDEDRRMAAGVITDNDPQPFLQIRGAPQVTEGGTLSFVVRVGKEDGVEVDDIAQSFTVQVSTLDDAVARGGDCDWAALGEDCPWATANQDYNPVDDMLTFSPGGELSVPVVVATLDDESSPVGEPTEYVRLVLSGASAGAPALHTVHGNADGKILDDEATASISDVTPQDAAEGDPVVFRVDLDRAPTADVTLDYAFEPDGRPGAHLAARAAGDSCTPGDDYLGAAGQVTVTAPSQQATFEVPTCPDVLVERGETFWVGLSRAENGGEVVVPAGTGEWGTIRNDDIAVVSVTPAAAEGTEGQADSLAFTVGLTVGGRLAQLSEGVTVGYEIGGSGSDPATAPGEPGADYAVKLDTATLGSTLRGTVAFTVATSGTPAVTEHLFEVELLADHLLEDRETLQLTLSDADPSDGWMLAEVVATGTIVDDAPPVLSVGDFTGAEGTDQSFAVTLADARSGETVTVDYDIAGAGVDPATNPAAGETLHDYTAATGSLSGRLTFPGGAVQLPDGSLRHSVGVSLLPDAINEYPETLRLVLSDPHMAVLADRDPGTVGVQAYGEGTIEDVDPPVLSVSGFSGAEGTTQSFIISLSGARANKTVTVDYAISGDEIVDNGDTATAPGHRTKPADFEPVPDTGPLTGTVTLAPGTPCQTTCTVEVSLLADYVPDEGDETLRLTLANPSGAVLSGSDRDNSIDQIHGVGTIEDVDPPVLSVRGFTGAEGTGASFVVSLANARSGKTVTVDYVIAGAGDDPATNPDTGETRHDYTVGSDPHSLPDSRLLSGSLNFPYPVNERSVRVSLRSDGLREAANETLRLTLQDPTGAVLFDHDPVIGVPAYGEGTIFDVDAPYLFVGNTAAREGEPLTFTVSLCNPVPGEDVAVSYQTRAHSAAAGLDFVAAGDTLDFPDTLAVQQVSTGCGAGVDAKSRTVQVTTLTDRVEESDEEVHLVLSNRTPASVRFGKSIGVGRIINVSAATVRVSNPTAVEGGALLFTISLVDNDGNPAVITAPVTVYYATQDGTAIAGTDYTAVPANPGPCLSVDPPPARCPFVTFDPADNPTPDNPDPAGRRHTVSVPTAADFLDEDDKTVALVLRLAEGAEGTDNAGLGDTEGTGTIADAEPPSLRIEDAAATQEGEVMTFEVRLGRYDAQRRFTESETNRAVTVSVATEDATATAGADYTAVSRRLMIPAGETSATIEVQTVLDDVNEPDEWLTALLSNPSNALIDRAAAGGEIIPSCVANHRRADPPIIIVLPRRYDEGEDLHLYFELSRPVCSLFSIAFEFRSGTADCGSDFSFSCDGIARQIGFFPHLVSDPVDQRAGGIFADGIDEPDETVILAVSWGSTMPVPWRRVPAVVREYWIIDGDPAPSLSISDAAANEGEDLTFDVSLDTASGREVNVQYRTVQRSGTNAADPVDDYEPVTDWSPITFAPGATSMPIMVRAVIDGDPEDDETFLVELREPPDTSTPLNAVIVDSVAVGTILSSSKPRMSIADASADEGDTMEFVVTLSEPAPGPVTVSYATAELTGRRAAGAGDYEPVNDSLMFEAGDTEMSIAVEVNMDGETEVDESFLVELSGPSPDVVLTDSSAVGTINGNVTCIDLTAPGAVVPAMTVTSPGATEGDGQMTFTVQLIEPICSQERVRAWDTGSPGDAQPTRDYILDGFTAMPALVFETTFQALLIDDDIDETDERIVLQVEWLTPIRMDAAVATGTIFDDDQASLSVAGTSGAEGGFLNFVIRLDRPSSREVTVAYATEDASPLSAEAGADYRARSNIAVIPPGELSAPVAVFAPQDRLDEDAETFLLRLSNPTGGAELADADAVATGTIFDDDDAPPSLRVSDASTDEGGDLAFTVILDAPSGREVRVPVATRDDTARAAEGDYVARASGDAVFAPGETRQTIRVRTLADGAVESPEGVFLDLGPMRNNTATIDKATGYGVIRDVSDRSLSVSDASVVEGGTLAFEVGFAEEPSSRDVVVRYRTRAGTAAAGGDYYGGFEAVPWELRIVAGDTSTMVLVPTVDDSLDEDNESLELVLSDPQGAVIVAGAASGVIIDDDPLPALSVSDTEASEGDGVSATFTLSLSEPSGRPVTVTYDTADGTAKKDGDYTEVSGGSLVIDAGDDQATVDVALVDDDDAEEVETFRLQVSSVTNASRDDSVGVATIADDDGLVQILVDDPAAVHEGEGVSAVFTVRLSRADGSNPVTVMYSTADGTATKDDDYIAATAQTLIFVAGEKAKTVSVALVNDDDVEPAETFRLVLSSPSSNAELGDGEASVLIRDDDGLPTLSVADAVAATEGSTASFAVTLSRAVPQEVTVDYAAVVDPVAADEAAATPGQDYTAVSGTVTFAARATEATVTVPLLDDSLDENTETFWLRLASPVGATIAGGTATGTIADDDPLPDLSILDAGATEGAPLTFEVRLAPVSSRTVTVPWATEALASGVGAASPGADYTAATGTVTLAPGTTTARVAVATLPDDVSEADETFLVQLGTPANAALDDSTAVGAIRDDDGLPRILIAHTTVTEDAGPAIFTVTLSHPSSQPVTVRYSTADGTAHSPPADPYDYVHDQERILTIPASFTVGEISVFINDDDLAEGTETFTITLTDPVNAVIAEGAGTATGTIHDDDGAPRASLAAATATEGDATIEFPVTLSHAAASDVTVRYSTFDGTAAQPGDYIATTATLTIPASSTTATIAVALTDDGFVEDAESFLLRLHDPTGLEIAAAEAVAVIFDDDDLPLLSIQQGVRVNEDVGSVTLRVMLSRPSDAEVTVEYYVTALSPRTCPAAVAVVPGALVFAPGAVVRTFEVQIVNDTSLCSNSGIRGARVYLRNPRNAEIDYRATNTAIGVFDLQVQPCVVLGGVTVVGEDVGVAVLSVGLQRSHTENVTVTLDTIAATPQSWTVFTASATAGDDYVALSSHTVDVPAGTLLVPVEVTIVDDTDPEEAEGFGVRVSSAAGADAACGGFNPWRAIAILDDDSTREVSVADVSVQESGTAIFVVSLDVAATIDITVDYTTVDGTAAQPGDYTETAGTVRIPAGAPSALVEVPLVDDTDTEPDETFTLRLTAAAGAGIADDEATATINDNDGSLPVVRLAHDETIDQGLNTNALIVRTVLNDGDVARVLESGHGDFYAFLDDPATTPVTFSVNLIEVPSLGGLAASRSEFAIGGGITNLRIMNGDTEAWVSVFITKDNIPELDERFLMVLNDPVDASLEIGHVWVEIIDDDVPIVTVADVVADESAGNVVFNVQLHAAAVHPASLRYTTRAIRAAGDGAASPGEDYSTVSGTVDIPAGATSATISVPILGDRVDEPAETFLLVLSDPELLAMGDSVAVGTIVDDDPGFWIDDRSVRENIGTVTFTVERDHTSTGDVAVDYRFGDGGSAVGGTACTVDGVDFEWPSGSASGTVTMPAADTEVEISVAICNDETAEGREILLVELTNVTGRKTTAVGTIVDND